MLICRGTATLKQDCSKRSAEQQGAHSRGIAGTGSGKTCAGLVAQGLARVLDATFLRTLFT
eukprot:6410427-Alexandrium_andersonii.AAC.1